MYIEKELSKHINDYVKPRIIEREKSNKEILDEFKVKVEYLIKFLERDCSKFLLKEVYDIDTEVLYQELKKHLK